MVGDQVTDSLDDESGLQERSARRHRRAVSLIALAAVVFVFASAAYLNMSGASLLGAFLAGASHAQTQSPADNVAQGGGLIDPGFAPPLGTQIPRTTGLVRDGAIGAVVQRFGGMNDKPPLTLIASVQIKEAAVTRGLIRDLNALPAFPAGGMSCPMDDGSYFRIIFAYVDGTHAAVKLEATGCTELYLEESAQPVAWAATSRGALYTLEGLFTQGQGG